MGWKSRMRALAAEGLPFRDPVLSRRRRKCRGDDRSFDAKLANGYRRRGLRPSESCMCPRHVAKRARRAAEEAKPKPRVVVMSRTRPARVQPAPEET